MATFEYANADDLVAVKPIVEEHFPDVKEGQVVQTLHDQFVRVLLLKNKGEIQGAAVYRVHDDADFCDLIFFCTTAHRKGLGRALLAQLKQELFEEGDTQYIVIYSGRDAVDFWTKHGFVEGLADLSEEMVSCRMQWFDNAVRMTYDMTAEFESDAAKTMKANVRPGDLVMVRHGNRFPIYRQAWVTETTEKKLLAEYTDIKRQKDWIPFGSRRLLCDALAGDTALEQEPVAFTKEMLEQAKKKPTGSKRKPKAKPKAAAAPPAAAGAAAPAPKAAAKAASKKASKVAKKIAKPKKKPKSPPRKSTPAVPAWANSAGGHVTKGGRKVIHR